MDIIIRILLLSMFFASTTYAELKLDAVYPTLGAIGKDLEVQLMGKQFDIESRVSMYLDTANKRAILGATDTRGHASGLTVVGTIAYVADSDAGLQIIDVSSSSSPQIIGTIDTPGYAQNVAVVGTTAYVADGNAGLQIIDVSILAKPKIIGAVKTPDFARGVTVVGTTAYVADDDAGLQVVDVNKPTSPKIVGFIDTNELAHDVIVIGKIAYVADYRGGFHIIDVSTPSKPSIIGSVVTPGFASGVTVVGTIAYVADWYFGLQVIDVSNPKTPQIIGAVDTPGAAGDVVVVGTIAYVADGQNGLQVIDVSTPSSPTIIGTVDTPGRAEDVFATDSITYVADGDNGILVIDVSTPLNQQIIGSVETTGGSEDVEVVGTTAYVADDSSGLHVIDVSDPSNPKITGSVDKPGNNAESVAVVGTIAYVADWNAGLQIIDVSTPSSPKILGSVDTPGNASDVTVVGTTAYVADFWIGLQVIDVSNGTNPRVVGLVDTLAFVEGVTVAGTKAYIVAGGTGLHVIDVSTPSSPKIISSVDTPGYASDVTVVGTTAYVADGETGLHVIDVSNPADPQIIGSVETPGHASDVTVVGTTAYVADSDAGIQMIDISKPSSPLIIGTVDTPRYAQSVKVIDNYAYVANMTGLVIVPIPKEIKPVTVNSETRIFITLPNPIVAGRYTLRVFNETQSEELRGAVTFADDLQIFDSKAIIVAGGGPEAPGEIWAETKLAANKAYDTLIYEGYDHDSIYYLSMESGNPFVDGPSMHYAVEDAIKNWAADASEVVIYFVDHGLPDRFIIFANIEYSEVLNVDELDDWLDALQQDMIGPLTFIYDACNSGTFASKLGPPANKDRIVITGASDEPAYFRGEDTFSFQFWDQIYHNNGNIGEAFSAAADIMQGYQTAMINADGDSLTNESEDIDKALDHIIRRGQPIYLKPPPALGNVVGSQTLSKSISAPIWVSDVKDAESVWCQIIPPDINSDIDGVPITDLPSVELLGPDDDRKYKAIYDGFTKVGTYTIIASAQTSQKIYSYVEDAERTQIIKSLPVFTTVTKMDGEENISKDAYEEDDTYLQASVITLNDLDVQLHNFHDLGDVDWVKFYALSGQTYTIEAYNASVASDVVIELFDSDGTTRLKGPMNEAGDGEEEILEWTCTREDGLYYVKVTNANATFGENCKYDLKIYRPIGPLAGFVNGLVADAMTRQRLSEVLIKTNRNQTALSLSDGHYLMVHPPGTVTVTAEKAGYTSKDIPSVRIHEGGTTSVDVSLEPFDEDGDGIPDAVETASDCLNFNDADSDDDGILDGDEDENRNGLQDAGETDPCDPDTDSDGLQDGTERGYTSSDIHADTDRSIFQPDLDPSTTTDPLDKDSDNDGLSDGREDRNHNGRVDSGETDPGAMDKPRPHAMPWLHLLLE